MKQLVGAQLYTIREFMNTEEAFIASMKKVREMGFEYVTYSAVAAPLTPVRVREIMDELGLKIACTHIPWERLLHETEQVAQEHLILGCPIVGLSWCGEHTLTTMEDLNIYIDLLKKIGRTMRKHGLTFAIHNHCVEFHRHNGKTALQIIKEETDPEDLSFIFCCYWAQHSGADSVEYLREFADRIAICHYKDRMVLDGEPTYTTVGQGNMNYKAIFKVCEEIGIQHAMIEQDTCQKDPFVSLAEGREYLLSLGEAYDKGEL